MFEFNSKEINRDVTQEPLISEVNNLFHNSLSFTVKGKIFSE